MQQPTGQRPGRAPLTTNHLLLDAVLCRAVSCCVTTRRNIHSSSVWNNESLSWHCPMSPSDSELWDASPLAHQPPSLPAAAAAAAAAAAGTAANGHGPAAAASGAGAAAGGNGSSGWQAPGAAEGGSGSSGSGGGASGVYKCAALFPSAATSLKLGRNNLHLFRCVVGRGQGWVVCGWCDVVWGASPTHRQLLRIQSAVPALHLPLLFQCLTGFLLRRSR
jgi:hypothetical protein